MRRRPAIIGAAAGTALLGGLFLTPSAQADPVICINLDIQVNDQGGAQSICLPPEDGGGTPGLPELPGAPELPGLPA